MVDFLLAPRRKALALVSVSDHQRAHLAGTDPWRTIHNAVDTNRLAFAPRPDPGYLAFLGRLTPDKGVHVAIEVARRLGRPLRIAGNVSDEAGARQFFETRVRPQLGDGIEWVGPVDDEAKVPFLQNAAALLMPIQWDEPFGLVVAEALACGTPVLAMRRGSMPEIIHDGITGSCVVRRGLDCEVWLIGEGSRRRELEALITAEGLGDRVHLLGMRRDVPELVGQLDLFVFATTPDEGLGIALIEAMAVGVPVVASDVGACREVLDDGALGLLVPPGGPVALADAIERVRDDPETAAARVERARRKAFEVFDAERMAAAYADVLGLGAVGAGSALQAA